MPTPAQQNSSSLRSRKVDFKKPLLVFKLEDIPLSEQNSILERNIPTFATGVEKEEEEEHHLQAALIASQNALAQVTIPTPDASKLFSDYSLYYLPDYTPPKSYIRSSTQIEESMGTLYNLDEKDDIFLSNLRSEASFSLSDEEFESIMWILESMSNEKMNSGELPSLLQCSERVESQMSGIDSKLFSLVYDHWKVRRFEENSGKPIQAILRFEEHSLKPDMDPYVCFRKREIKPVRKARRGDGQALEKLKRLREELLRAREILEWVVSREQTRKESLLMDALVFEQKCIVRKMQKKLGIVSTEKEWDTTPIVKPRKKVKKEYESTKESTKIRIPMHKIRDSASMVADLSPSQQYVLSLEDQIKAKKLTEEKDGWLDLTEDPFISVSKSQRSLPWTREVPFVFTEKEKVSHPPCRVQRRIGRGGRIVLDRHVKKSRTKVYEESSEGTDSDKETLDPEDDDDFWGIKTRILDFGPKEANFYLFGNNPSHIEQINIQPAPLGYHPITGPPPSNVIRAPIPVKRKNKLQSESKNVNTNNNSPSATAQNKKKSQEHPQLKAMMVQAQRVAAAQQSQSHWNSMEEVSSPTFKNAPPSQSLSQQFYMQQQQSRPSQDSPNRKVPN